MGQKTHISTPSSIPNVADVYAPTQGANIRRTCIQGMSSKPQANIGGTEDAKKGRAVRLNLQSRPLAAILYSISHDALGEIFPIYVGRNTIGSDPEMDVYLPEESVSPCHAIILIRHVPDADGNIKVTMNISDYDSQNGTIVNDTQVSYDRENLYGDEIITIGKAYRFLFIPLHGDIDGRLYVDPEFKALERKDLQDGGNVIITANLYETNTPKAKEIYPNVVGESEEATFYGRTKPKVADNSSNLTIDNVPSAGSRPTILPSNKDHINTDA